jgi:hypothetical protein
MRSMLQILNLVQDGEISTKEQAAALVAEEAAENAVVLKITEEEARATLLANIGYVTGYLSHKQADNVMELFNTQHPIFGRTHPTAEEALRLRMEYGKRSRERSKIDEPKAE